MTTQPSNLAASIHQRLLNQSKTQGIDFNLLLDLPRPRLRAYCPETTIAEKLHAMVILICRAAE